MEWACESLVAELVGPVLAFALELKHAVHTVRSPTFLCLAGSA